MRSFGITLLAVACYSGRAFAQSAPTPDLPIKDWYNERAHVGVTISANHGATVEFACQTIAIDQWHADGKAMTGKVFKVTPPGKKTEPETVTVIALPAGEHQLVVVTEGDRFTLTPGKGEQLDCGVDPFDGVF